MTSPKTPYFEVLHLSPLYLTLIKQRANKIPKRFQDKVNRLLDILKLFHQITKNNNLRKSGYETSYNVNER